MVLDKLIIKNFKRFDEVEIELANPVIFIGPNNSGKTSALQALALWSIGLRKWIERRESGNAKRRPGVTINRRELLNIPLLRTHSLWRSLRVRQANTPIKLEITVEGIENDKKWVCALQFESADQENIRCRPKEQPLEERALSIPEGARQVKVAFLPPMSGLISQEDLLQPGSIERRIGEGRTADVLRNLCYRIWESQPETHDAWKRLSQQVRTLFGIEIQEPEYDSETGTLSLEYREQGVTLDLTSSGQGFRQTLLLLAYLYTNPRTVMLLDEPDAHLEILRQRQIYQTFVTAAQELGNQVIIATHSEVILNEAAQRDFVVAFVGKPHRITKDAQVRKALAQYGFDDYFQAEQTGWVLYLEGSTDLAILQALARRLDHPAQEALKRPFVHYVGNETPRVQNHFYAMREAVPAVRGLAIFDRMERALPPREGVEQLMWRRREIENYLAFPETLLAFITNQFSESDAPIFGQPFTAIMDEVIRSRIPPIALGNYSDPWWLNTKMSDEFLTPLFAQFYARLDVPNRMEKSDFYRLADFVPAEFIAPEMAEKLDAVVRIANLAAEQRPQDTSLADEVGTNPPSTPNIGMEADDFSEDEE
jgi:hypothetical protein